MGIRDRLALLERRAAGGDMLIISIEGGLPNGEEPKTASAGALQWMQEPAETWAAFKVRVVEQAGAAGAGGVVIGGLPF